MNKLVKYVDAHEEWLMERVLEYAKRHGYAKYTSTLVEPWRQSIAGLSRALRLAQISGRGMEELGAEENYLGDPVTDFAVLEAKLHRERGVSLAMFLGLFKFYRQCYMDLVDESEFDPQQKQDYRAALRRFFDRIEIAFCSEWAGEHEGDRYRELRTASLLLTNEKNKYLTIFNSIYLPVFLVDLDNCLMDLNYAASVYLGQHAAPGSHYYGHGKSLETGVKAQDVCIKIEELLPWLAADIADFSKRSEDASLLEKDHEGKSLEISLSRMLDISGKFSGVVAIIKDVSEEKLASARKEERDKLKAAIETAGAVCHEMSQPMQVLLMRAEIAKMKASGNPVLQEELELIMQQITEMGDITHRLLNLTTYKTRNYMKGTDILDLN